MTSCPKCGAQLAMTDQFCGSCGANVETELQIQAFHQPALETARKWILAIGIIYVVSAFIMVAIAGDMMLDEDRNLLYGVSFALCAIHVGLWWWAKTAPFPAAVVALVLFITVQLINLAAEPSSFYKGIVIKILFLVALVRAVQAGLEANRLRGQR
jgi:hypothetical protein